LPYEINIYSYKISQIISKKRKEKKTHIYIYKREGRKYDGEDGGAECLDLIDNVQERQKALRDIQGSGGALRE